jgi:hypothetical protein
MYFSAGFQSVHPGHAQVKNNDVGLEAICLFDSFHAILRLIHDLPIGVMAQQGFQALSDYGMIVHNQNTKMHASHTTLHYAKPG